ncbi:MAG TPA: cytochrome c, partial [Pseudomonadaceae bacterium]|nr:cytochrome c [Pseudomonadaceae bacterium]
ADQALLENRRDLQPAFIRNVVRSGFNNMFPLSRGEVSDEQLDKIVAHLTRERS